MASVPAKAFDSMMAARRVQLPVPSLQKPSPGLLSAPSLVELTVKIVSKRAEVAADARARRAGPACDAVATCSAVAVATCGEVAVATCDALAVAVAAGAWKSPSQRPDSESRSSVEK
jgi:hypothetical protein